MIRAKRLLCDIVIEMRFIHSQGVVYRDVKPDNPVLDERGFAQIGISGAADSATLAAQIVPLLYMAPEMYDEAHDYITTVDVSSFALIVYEVLVGKSPFPLTFAPTAVMKKVDIGARPSLPADIGPAVELILEREWSVDPTMPPSFDEIFSVLDRLN
jgi:serine/threonine protein kinase